MKKYIQNKLLTFCIIMVLCQFCSPALAQVKGMWVVRYSLTSPMNVKKIVSEAHKAGVNNLFVQFYAKGEAYYNSKLAPRADCVSQGFDPLELMVKECKAKGIKIHAWINVFFVWSSDGKPRDHRHAYYRDEDWFAADQGGRSLKKYSQKELTRSNLEGVYLSPSNPDVKNYIRELVREILFKYDVDGIHLDYIRYGNMNYSYDRHTTNSFFDQYKVDPFTLGDNKALAPYKETWRLWRLYQITDLVSQLKIDIIKFNPWVKLSAAVKPDPDEARYGFGQDWPAWLQNRWVDFVVLMDYSTNTSMVVNLAVKAMPYRGNGKIYIGLGAWRDTIDGLMDKVETLRNAGINDIVLFSYDGLAQRRISFEMLKYRGF